MKYIDVIIDNNSSHTDFFYTYGCEYDDVKVGSRVRVPFALGNRERDAYVFRVHSQEPTHIKRMKYVTCVDENFALDQDTMEICEWMRKRYFCRYIEAVKCFLPPGKPLKSGKTRKPELPELSSDKEIVLTDEQRAALTKIEPFIEKRKHRTFLIHGVTGSGKTELYMGISRKCMDKGLGVIVLVPEISLTPQTVRNFLQRFGEENVAVMHSKLSVGERHDEWMRIKNGEAKIVIGARSAVFAPFSKLGAIIIDEEHEGSYKSDMSPKYDTVEVAIKRARAKDAITVLGSATPSAVSQYRVDTRLYEKISLTKRYNQVPLPEIAIADMREELSDGNKSIFSVALYESMRSNLESGKQVILFLNRRGYSTFISCRQCGYVMKCDDCGISLTYHKEANEAVCHFCGGKRKVPELCPECKSRYLKYFGTGTERVEEVTKELFPEYACERLDIDTAKKKGSITRILERFRKGKTKILIGTQLVAKGLDFSNVGLVGIVSADVTLNVPDFRSAERAFQLMSQAAGRAGRGDEKGHVIIQTYKPDHFAVRAAADNDYEGFYETEILLRKAMSYPPFSDLYQIVIGSESEQTADAGAEALKASIIAAVGEEDAQYKYILGPRPAPVGKQGNQYRFHLYIKVPPEKRTVYEEILLDLKEKINANHKNGYTVIIDVNPYSFM